MGKQYKSEHKVSKASQKPDENQIKKNRRCSSYSKKSKKVNKSSSPDSNTKLNNKNFPLDTGITALINSLDSPNSTSAFFISTEIFVKFPSNLTDRQFMNLFIKGINCAKLKFKKHNLTILKNILLFLKDLDKKDCTDDFGLQNCQCELQNTFKKDLILTLLTDESKIESLKIKDPNDAVNVFKLSIEYGIYISNNDFKNSLLYNANDNGNYSFQKFNNILFSSSIVTIYQQALFDLYDVYIPENDLKKIIKEFISKNNIFFMKMDQRRFGMLLYDGTIIINLFYYVNQYSSIHIFIVYYTLLHEIMHALSRLIRGDENYFLNTDEFIKAKGQNIKADESGNFFEHKFLICVILKQEITELEANYLLDTKNYEHKTIKEFHDAFKKFRIKNAKTIKSSPCFAIGKSAKDNTISLKIGCYCAGSRNSY
mgnify:CR=1 FL=1